MGVKGIDVHKHGRCEHRLRIRRVGIFHMVFHGSHQYGTLNFQPIEVQRCSQRQVIAEAMGIDELAHISIQLVPSEVVTKRCAPHGKDVVNV